tara:strand:+ start:490 stop:867 length:378 start_codon:yes stop_codon:yes gene_type:complete
VSIGFWTPERDALVCTMWKAGHSMQQIGDALGTTRSAVSSRMRRLKKMGVLPAPPPPDKKIVPFKGMPPPRKPKPVTLMALERMSCRWPVIVHDDGPLLYCGGQREHGSSYCSNHTKASRPQKRA